MQYFLILLITIIYSTLMYIYLRKKTHMNLKMLYLDNVWTALISGSFSCLFFSYNSQIIYSLIISLVIVPIIGFIIVQIRFWRSPKRKLTAEDEQIVSPADGNIIYINKITKDDKFISIKNGKISNLSEITDTDMISKPCWQIGINMTPFDVHKNCSPIDGNILLSKHIDGKFHSLKEFKSMVENERHTYVIKNNKISVGVVQIASKLVRRIDSYVDEGQEIGKGDWVGMIRFGSQVDVFLPIDTKISVSEKQQIYAKKTIIAEL